MKNVLVPSVSNVIFVHGIMRTIFIEGYGYAHLFGQLLFEPSIR